MCNLSPRTPQYRAPLCLPNPTKTRLYMLNTLVFEAIPTIAMASSISSSSSDKDYKSNDYTTNLEGLESENEAIPTNSNNECNEDKDVNNKAIPRYITYSYTYIIILFTNTPNPNAIDDELL